VIKDWDRLSADDLMGEIVIPILDVAQRGTLPPAEYRVIYDNKPAGTLLLGLQFSAKA